MSMVRPLRQGDRIGRDLLRCMSLEVAHRVCLRGARPCPELGVEPTCRSHAWTSQFDPYETSIILRRRRKPKATTGIQRKRRQLDNRAGGSRMCQGVPM